MFANHQPIISEYARQNPDNFARVLKFVILTIRARLFNLPAAMETLENPESESEQASLLYGFKSASIAQIDADADSLFEQAELIFYHAESPRAAAESLLNLFTTIHGFGLAKAGFAAQLIYGVSACLDSHNIERFNIAAAALKSSTFKNAKTAKTRAKWIRRYCELVEKCGGTESLWDSWCEYVFNKPDPTGYKMSGNKSAYKSVNHVSAIHCESLGLAVN